MIILAAIQMTFVTLDLKASCYIYKNSRMVVFQSQWLLLETSTTALKKAAFITGAEPRVSKFGVKVQECSLANIYGDFLTLLSLLCCVPDILIIHAWSHAVMMYM